VERPAWRKSGGYVRGFSAEVLHAKVHIIFGLNVTIGGKNRGSGKGKLGERPRHARRYPQALALALALAREI
jgi:hypothetical protein